MRTAFAVVALVLSLVACRDSASVRDPGFDDIEKTLSSVEADVDAP
ncbi:hypothetical protein [Actinosynnema sp. NPDC020468]